MDLLTLSQHLEKASVLRIMAGQVLYAVNLDYIREVGTICIL